MNVGIAAAKGKFIASIASDDIWMTNKLTKQLNVAACNEDLVVWSEGELIDDKRQLLEKNFTQLHLAISRKKSENIFQELLRENYIFGSTLFYKRSNLGAIRYDESLQYLSDYKFMLELARKYNFYYLAKPMAKYRIHGANTLIDSDLMVKECRRMTLMKEKAFIYEEILRQNDYKILNKTKADMYAEMSCTQSNFGERKKAVCLFLQAIGCTPFRRSILISCACIFKHLLKKTR